MSAVDIYTFMSYVHVNLSDINIYIFMSSQCVNSQLLGEELKPEKLCTHPLYTYFNTVSGSLSSLGKEN